MLTALLFIPALLFASILLLLELHVTTPEI
jgi:hypothetical protein